MEPSYDRSMTSVRETAAQLVVRALEEEAAGNWLESHVLCERALAQSPQDPDALNVMGRLCGVAGDPARAIALQSFVLHLDPSHARAAADLERARFAIDSTDDARDCYDRALRIEPEIACHLHSYLGLVPFAGIDRAEVHLRECLQLDPGHARAHAALANLHARRKAPLAAIEAYSLAVMLDWSFAEAHVALAGLLDAIREEGLAVQHRRAALERRRFFPACGASANADRSVLVLATPGGIVANVPLDLAVNPSRTALHRYYLIDDADPAPSLPPYDLIFNGIEELESSAASIELAARFADASAVPVLNHPRNAARTRRTALARALAGIDGLRLAPTIRAERAELLGGPHDVASAAGVAFPIIIRPVDSHRGDGLERAGGHDELAGYLERHDGERFYVAPFVDYRSADGYYRKYRAIVVDGVPFPYHLAISDRWIVHYAGSLMERHAWMREEEERFLRDPASVFDRWEERFGAVAPALGLESFGVDCTLLADGSILVFECNAGMLVHCADDPALFAYKYAYVPRIFDAVERLLRLESPDRSPKDGR